MAKIDINSSWSILPADMLATYNAFGDQDDIEQTLIQPGLVEVLKSMSAKYDAYQLQQKAAVIAEESRLEMGTWLKESFALRGLTSRVDVATVLYPHVKQRRLDHKWRRAIIAQQGRLKGGTGGGKRRAVPAGLRRLQRVP